MAKHLIKVGRDLIVISLFYHRSGGDKGGGGLCILYKSSLSPHEWMPEVPEALKYVAKERQWLLVDNGKERVALLHCYVACQNSRNDDFMRWNEDLFLLMSTELTKLKEQGFMVVCMGDFNSRIGRLPGLEGNNPDVNKNGPMFINFVTQANLVIMNTLPVAKGLFTRFMNGSQSLLDYGLVDSSHVNTVTSFVIDAEARYDCGSDHALLLASFVFGERPKITWEFQDVLRFNITPRTNYTAYQNALDCLSSTVPLHRFDELTVEEKLSHITSSIIESGKKTIGLKVKKKRQGRRIPRNIIAKIKEKNKLARQVQQACTEGQPDAQAMRDRLDTMKLGIKDDLVSLKLEKRHRLRSKLLLGDPSRKKFWRFLKNQIKSAGNITASYDIDGKMVFQQEEIEDAVISHFSSIFDAQRSPVFSSPDCPDMVALSIQEIDNILANMPQPVPESKFESEVCSPYTIAELADILSALPAEKAAGFDQVPNELLKHSSFKFRQYLLAFLNQILEDGHIPEILNVGKCMLVHKVGLSCFST